MEDRRITVRELADEIGVSIGSVHSILTEDLGMRSVREIRTETAHLIQTFVAKHNIRTFMFYLAMLPVAVNL
jgi:hypothetical protein